MTVQPTTTAPVALDDLQGWIGKEYIVEDEIALGQVRRIAAMLDDERSWKRGDRLPAHWLSLFFADIAPQTALGADGHPKKGGFLPPIALPRRMFAGRRVRYHLPVAVGAAAYKRSVIKAISPRQGRSGLMVFVTIGHDYVDSAHRLLAQEEQDVVYREMAVADAPRREREFDSLPKAIWTQTRVPDPVLLLRFSAITFNGHRIHYDADYTRQVEGYPKLVMNGGLTTLLLLDAAIKKTDCSLSSFSTRLISPLFVGEPIELCGGNPDTDSGNMPIWAVAPNGALAAKIDVEWEL